MFTTRRNAPVVLATRVVLLIALVAVVIPASASAQASRTWVSGVGDDANPCSRTAPCKTFAGAISKTAAKGEINTLDPGGFGTLNITKSITVDGSNTQAGVLAAGTTGISVNAAATDRIVLRGLNINGFGTGLNGIRVIQAKSVKVYDTKIFGFTQNGLSFAPTNANAKALIENSVIEDNSGNGVLVAPPSAAGNNARVTISNSTIVANACGVTATNHLLSGNFPVDCGTAAGVGGGSANANVFGSTINDHDATVGATGSAAVFTNGGSSSIRIGDNLITGNVFGLRALDVGFGGIFSFATNSISGNATNGTPNATIGPA